MEQRMNRSDEFYRKRIAQLEPELRRSELARTCAEDSSRRAWALASWVRRPSEAPHNYEQRP
jgi:hypothetical protein